MLRALRQATSPSFAWRRGIALGALALTALAAAGSGTAAKGPPTQRDSASLIYLINNANGTCGWGIGIEFGNVAGAVSYEIQYYDGYWKTEEYATVAPDQLAQGNAQLKLGKKFLKKLAAPGSHFYGITGGVSGSFAGPVKCDNDPGDVTEGGRFGKDMKVTAVFPAGYKPKKKRKHPSIFVAITPAVAGSSVAADTDVDVKVKVTAGPVALSTARLDGQGLLVSGRSAKLDSKPSGFSGFSLAAGGSRVFTFRIHTLKTGTVTLTANATGSSSSGEVRDAARATIRVGEPLAIDWTMPARLTDAEAGSWSADDGVAPSSYVYPKDWKVNLFLKSSAKATCPEGETFKWTLTGGGKTIAVPGDSCKETATVPKLGVYDVTAKEYADGVATGATIENKQVVVRDWLIVGVGDSNGSGQGNPPYLDKQCDRGMGSYQYRLAQSIEDADDRSSVTFLFASCSGARSDHLWQSTYAGQESTFHHSLEPQFFQVEQRLDDGQPRRKVDAMIISIGINDIQFGSIMGFCTFTVGCNDVHVTETPDPSGDVAFVKTDDTSAPTLAANITAKINALHAKYQAVKAHLGEIDPAQVFITQYPDETTAADGSTCSGTQGPFPHLLKSVWAWLHTTGGNLNAEVAATASLGWTPVTGIPERFKGHGYCSTDSYFDALTSSLVNQRNLYGSFHATGEGQKITAGQALPLMCEKLYGNADCSGIAPAP